MAKLVLNDITAGHAATTALDTNFDAIETAFENTLSRDGTTPNQMGADLDMNSYNILNQGNPITVSGFVWEGQWTTSTAYTIGDAVQEGGNAYICIADHTSGTFATDLAALKWQLLAQANIPSQTGNAGKYLTTDGVSPFWEATPFVDATNKEFGATGDGVTDDTTALQSWATDATKNKILPPGNYLVTGTITPVAGSTIHAYGARIFDTVTHRTLIDCSNGGITIKGLEVEGAGNSSADSAGILIKCVGTDNSPSAPTYVDGPTLIDCKLHDTGFYGVFCQYTEGGLIDNCEIYDVAYACFMGLSVSEMDIRYSHLHDITPGSGSLAYGAAFSRMVDATSHNNLTPDPRSQDCSVSHCLIENNTIYEGVDTHAGQGIRFTNNIFRNVKRPINISFSHLSAVGDFASLDCYAIDNTIYGIGVDSGILVAGAVNGAAVVQRTEGCELRGNRIISGGADGTSTDGGIKVQTTKDLVISHNKLLNCHNNGIALNVNNIDTLITNNIIVDPHDDTNTVPAGIRIVSNNNTCHIEGNIIKEENGALDTYVCERGIYDSGSSGNTAVFGYNKVDAGTIDYFGFTSSSRNFPTKYSGSVDVTTSTGANNATAAVTFPRAFSSTPNIVVSDDQGFIGTIACVSSVGSPSTTGFTAKLITSDGSNFSSAVTVAITWSADGF